MQSEGVPGLPSWLIPSFYKEQESGMNKTRLKVSASSWTLLFPPHEAPLAICPTLEVLILQWTSVSLGRF